MPFKPGEQPTTEKGLLSLMDPVLAETDRVGSLERLWQRARTGRHEGFALGLDRLGEVPRYAAEERIRVRFTASRDAAVLLLAKDPGGSVTQLFPNEWHPSPHVNASELVVVPAAGRGDSQMAGTKGRHQLRLLVFSAGTNPLGLGVAEPSPPLAVERSYQVVE